MTYQSIRDQIRTGDILLFRGSHPLSKVIERIGDSPYSHVAFLTKWEGRIIAMQSDMRGVEVIPASMIVCGYRGIVEWWSFSEAARTKFSFDERDFLDQALTLVGIKYGFWSLIKVAVRMVLGISAYRGASHLRPSRLFCSSFVSLCYDREHIKISKKGGVEGTSPGDFVKSEYFALRHQLFDGSDKQACNQVLETRLGPRRERGRPIAFWNGTEKREARAPSPEA